MKIVITIDVQGKNLEILNEKTIKDCIVCGFEASPSENPHYQRIVYLRNQVRGILGRGIITVEQTQ